MRVFCAATRAPEASTSGTVRCLSYQFAGERAWKALPEWINVTSPPGNTAIHRPVFVVKHLVYAVPPLVRPNVEWFSTRDRAWKRTPAPAKRNVLVRAGPGAKLDSYSVMLELKHPYLGVVSAEKLWHCAAQHPARAR